MTIFQIKTSQRDRRIFLFSHTRRLKSETLFWPEAKIPPITISEKERPRRRDSNEEKLGPVPLASYFFPPF